jgi:tetratricopeptide (TPR) repeat protein
MGPIDGLYPYEVVLLILGVLLFLVLLAVLVIQIVRGKPYAALLPFFVVTIAMIGFPGIQEIQWQKGVITIKTATTQLQADPTNATLRSNLANRVKSLADRPTSNPSALTSIARAQFALGKNDDAKTNLSKALRISPALLAAVTLKQRIDTDDALANLTTRLAQNPQDGDAKTQLAKTVAQTESLKISSPVFLSHVAKAKAILGDRAGASHVAATALKIDPNTAEANEMKRLAGNQQ